MVWVWNLCQTIVMSPPSPPQYQGYVKDEAEGSLRIHVFMASVPADGEDLEFAEAFWDEPIGRLSRGKKIQAFWGGEGSHLCGSFGRNWKSWRKVGGFFFWRHVGVGLGLIWLNVGLCLCFVVGNFDRNSWCFPTVEGGVPWSDS